jgi:hypothetical protein
MGLKKMPSQPKAASKGRPKKTKQPTQRTPRERIQVMGPSGKLRLEWRDR